jgi:hypothetical protein
MCVPFYRAATGGFLSTPRYADFGIKPIAGT